MGMDRERISNWRNSSYALRAFQSSFLPTVSSSPELLLVVILSSYLSLEGGRRSALSLAFLSGFLSYIK